MSKSPEAPRQHPSFDLELPPGPLKKPTWLDRFITPGAVSRIKYETPLSAKDGMLNRQERVEEELSEAYEKDENVLSSDKRRLGRLIATYRLLLDGASQEGNDEPRIASEVAAGLHLLKIEFEIDLPPLKVYQEEE